MATWERRVYAEPGDVIHWPQDIKFSRPFFYNPGTVMIDDKKIAEMVTVKPFTLVCVVACFPDLKTRGAIVLVPDKGLWWWQWP